MKSVRGRKLGYKLETCIELSISASNDHIAKKVLCQKVLLFIYIYNLGNISNKNVFDVYISCLLIPNNIQQTKNLKKYTQYVFTHCLIFCLNLNIWEDLEHKSRIFLNLVQKEWNGLTPQHVPLYNGVSWHFLGTLSIKMGVHSPPVINVWPRNHNFRGAS